MFFIDVTIKSRLVHNPSSGRQITLLAAARYIILNYISFVLPTGFRTFHFVSFLYVFSFLFFFFYFVSFLTILFSFFCVSFFFSFLFVTFLLVFFSFFFSFRFFSFFSVSQFTGTPHGRLFVQWSKTHYRIVAFRYFAVADAFTNPLINFIHALIFLIELHKHIIFFIQNL